ncbi:hypothetical protein [Nocardia neocaledoniensis]|uniref:hypothetical protein n=1 Tax=Nocardia neocaledoniensis TaxID=236511 RepID=UPI0024576B51|nr:hypothetical protein [Nocardia neocaledoniensis]
MTPLCPETRLAAYGSVSTALALLSDQTLRRVLDAAAPLGSGIGGKAVSVEVAGRQVFVKRVPLTERELRPENVRSTANLFDLPMYCHYGIGGPAFGAWRELAAHVMTTDWVLTGEVAERAVAMADRELRAGIAFMNAHGLLHFDVHFENVLTDGEHLYFADYGLAISSRFELANDERAFYDRHRNYDRRYAAMYTGQWLVAELFGAGRDERAARLRAYAAGRAPTGIPESAAAILTRDAPVAVAMTEFFDLLRDETRRAPYPAEL